MAFWYSGLPFLGRPEYQEQIKGMEVHHKDEDHRNSVLQRERAAGSPERGGGGLHLGAGGRPLWV